MHGNDRAPIHIPRVVSHSSQAPGKRQHARRNGGTTFKHICRDCGSGARGGVDILSVSHARASGEQSAKEIGHGVAKGPSQKEAD